MATESRVTARRVPQALVWVVLAGVTGALAAGVAVPALAGASTYTVLTGSMRPELSPGTLVVVRPTAVEEIGVGSVVTYQLRSGEPQVVTHRVVEQGLDASGEPVFRTRGDANDSVDQEWVRPVQVRGTVWYAVPHLGRVGLWLSSWDRQLLRDGIVVALMAYAAVMFLQARRQRRDAGRPPRPGVPVEVGHG